MHPRQAMRTVRLGVAASRGDGGPAQSCLDARLYDAATQLDPLDRDSGMLDHLARNSFEFCFCGWQTHQTNPEQGSVKCSGSLISPPHRLTSLHVNPISFAREPLTQPGYESGIGVTNWTCSHGAGLEFGFDCASLRCRLCRWLCRSHCNFAGKAKKGAEIQDMRGPICAEPIDSRRGRVGGARLPVGRTGSRSRIWLRRKRCDRHGENSRRRGRCYGYGEHTHSRLRGTRKPRLVAIRQVHKAFFDKRIGLLGKIAS
jgi:hypothetical protein